MTVDILAIGAHPDDVELSCGGTILKHIHLGKTTGIIDLTRGELGTRGDATTRRNEAESAAKILGVMFRENLGMEDGFFENNKLNQLKLVERIRKYRPDMILTNALNDRHPDHGRAAKMVADACFLAGLKKVITKENNDLQEVWRPKMVLHYIQDRYVKPDVVIDISGFMEKRMDAIKAYKSQFYDEHSNEPETPISSKQFMDMLYNRPKEWGRMIGVQFAEGFLCERIIGTGNIFDLI